MKNNSKTRNFAITSKSGKTCVVLASSVEKAIKIFHHVYFGETIETIK
jgi:hypothetical protein